MSRWRWPSVVVVVSLWCVGELLPWRAGELVGWWQTALGRERALEEERTQLGARRL